MCSVNYTTLTETKGSSDLPNGPFCVVTGMLLRRWGETGNFCIGCHAALLCAFCEELLYVPLQAARLSWRYTAFSEALPPRELVSLADLPNLSFGLWDISQSEAVYGVGGWNAWGIAWKAHAWRCECGKRRSSHLQLPRMKQRCAPPPQHQVWAQQHWHHRWTTSPVLWQNKIVVVQKAFSSCWSRILSQ